MPNVLDQLATHGPQQCAAMSYEQASDYTRQLAKSHYENFTVVSWFLPKRLRDDFRHVYSFCRWADDLGDEAGSKERSLELLAWWRGELDLCYQGEPRHPVFVALRRTIETHDIPRKPFDDLIDAFVQDQHVARYQTWEQVTDYCTRSADPVGRLVLHLCGHHDEERQRLSDFTCTALQLANFWQDVRRDVLERDRVYIPADIASANGLDIQTMIDGIRHDAAMKADSSNCCSSCNSVPRAAITAQLPAFRRTIRELCERTWPLFEKGRELWPRVAKDVRLDIQLFSLGGEAILKMIRRQQYDTLNKRPSVGKGAKLILLMRALSAKFLGFGMPRLGASGSPRPVATDGTKAATTIAARPVAGSTKESTA